MRKRRNCTAIRDATGTTADVVLGVRTVDAEYCTAGTSGCVAAVGAGDEVRSSRDEHLAWDDWETIRF